MTTESLMTRYTRWLAHVLFASRYDHLAVDSTDKRFATVLTLGALVSLTCFTVAFLMLFGVL